MRKLKLTKKLQERFLEELADTGSVSTAASVAGTSRTRVERNGFAVGGGGIA